MSLHIACIYENNWYIGKVLNIDEFDEVTLRTLIFFYINGPLKYKVFDDIYVTKEICTKYKISLFSFDEEYELLIVLTLFYSSILYNA